MNPSYYLTAFLPPTKDVDHDDLSELLRAALQDFKFRVEIDMADEDDNLDELIDDDTRREFAESGLSDLDLLSKDLLLSLDDYPILIAFTEGDEVADLASTYDELEGLSDSDLWTLKHSKSCIELFAEENDPDQRYHAAIEAIAERLRRDWNALVVEGNALD